MVSRKVKSGSIGVSKNSVGNILLQTTDNSDQSRVVLTLRQASEIAEHLQMLIYELQEDMVWKCIVCEQTLEPEYKGSIYSARWPNIEGGTISIDFGYGSKFDQMNGFGAKKEVQSCICDKCFEQKKHLTREVTSRTITKWKLVEE
ncbi:hypothetical protein LCGC14_1162680 [marine sediment metagenome]|uniref:Uncharacterized protein n=1 Tax=marine sediment metagenome TaxID=412755 RepID=A0A0F9LS22_9ZZZZ